MTFRLILDEMISPNISPGLWEAGVDNYAIRDRGLLHASDYQVWAQGCSTLSTESRMQQLSRS
jgi:predicted nuclease of predicted toxin-antitoxin system